MENVSTSGLHTKHIHDILSQKYGDAEADRIVETAKKVVVHAADPSGQGEPLQTYGLLYGLIQSGKTAVMTAAVTIAIDNGYQNIIILTSDIDPLYDQTLARIRSHLRGAQVIGKDEWLDEEKFTRFLNATSQTPLVVVCSKNSSKMASLIQAFTANVNSRGVPTFIVDDEADQASLNTLTAKATEEISRINSAITSLRNHFTRNTYLQVTATPQSLFLQAEGHDYRPNFAILSEPGRGYVGGDSFFQENSPLLSYVALDEVTELTGHDEGSELGSMPDGLAKALFTFFVGATARTIASDSNDSLFSFLCHVSLKKNDQKYISRLISQFMADVIEQLNSEKVEETFAYQQLLEAYEEFQETGTSLPDFAIVLEQIKFFIGSANVKLVNSSSGQEAVTDTVFSIFVGGNKLGRGVTIEKLLVSYYGRNPKSPNADTVLQHARMYGYREKDKDVTRIFLPEELAENFKNIHQMEKSLRDLIADNPDSDFRGVLITRPVNATRRNVLDPGKIGYYVAGRTYNPRWPLRDETAVSTTSKIDQLLEDYQDRTPHTVSLDFIKDLLVLAKADPKYAHMYWYPEKLTAMIDQLQAKFNHQTGCLVTFRGREITTLRSEREGIHSGASGNRPSDLSFGQENMLTLYMFRQNEISDEQKEVWWPEMRLPNGNYVLAFSF